MNIKQLKKLAEDLELSFSENKEYIYLFGINGHTTIVYSDTGANTKRFC